MMESLDTTTEGKKMSDNLERLSQVREIIQKNMETMINDVWTTLAPENKTRDMGGMLSNAEHDLTKIIMDELVCINACD